MDDKIDASEAVVGRGHVSLFGVGRCEIFRVM